MVKTFAHIIRDCLPENVKKIFLLYDNTTASLVEYVKEAATELNKTLDVDCVDVSSRHGEEPPEHILAKMLRSQAVMCMTKWSLAHTSARKQLEELSIPFLSMPDYNMEMLSNDALMVDYKAKYSQVDTYSELLSECSKITIKSESGTELYLDVSGRKGNCCPGLTDIDHLLGSPPDIEANIAPIENKSEGIIVVDGSITDERIGLLLTSVELHIQDGAVSDIVSEDNDLQETVKDIFKKVGSSNAYIIGEFGIGFNDRASLCGNMLIDEGTSGCVHFGIGSNWTIGGNNKVAFHLDFVVRNTTVFFDGKCVIEKGKLLYGL